MAQSKLTVIARGLCFALTVMLSSRAGGQLAGPVEQLIVLDSTGKVVSGLVTALSPSVNDFPALAVLQIDGFVIEIGVTRNELSVRSGAGTSMVFESGDCSGTPLFRASSALLDEDVPIGYLRQYEINSPGRTVFVPSGETTPRPASIRSRLERNGECVPEESEVDDVIQAKPTVDLSVEFRPPFSLQVAPGSSGALCCADCDRSGDVDVGELITGVAHALQGCP
jgi:hypothetical protein